MFELQYQNQKLSSEEKMLRMICGTSSGAYLYYSFEEDYLRTLANWDFFFDVEIHGIKDIPRLYNCVEEKYLIPFKELLFAEKKQLKNDSLLFCLRDGRTWVNCEAAVSYSDDGLPKEKMIHFENVTKLKSQNDELAYLAYYDIQTGLYNRNYFVRLLGNFVTRAEEERATIAVLFIDIDDFRKVNDSMGIIVGDEIVQQFGQFLSSFKDSNVIVSHFNSDIYCVGIYDPCGARSVEHIYRMIQERLKTPFGLSSGQDVAFTVSIGVAEYPEAAKNTLELINCAEIVMFKAKSMGKNSLQNFNIPIINDFLENINIENKIKEASFQRNFMMYFQPQYHADDKRLRGVEALLRWKDDDGIMISPSVFIPIAEKNGTIVPIGSWAMEESMRIYSEWKKKYNYKLILSLNISAIQYKRSDFINNIMIILNKYEIEPAEIELEITESVLIDDFCEIKKKLITLRDYGFRISLDDFGTGYSSLSYLKGLPIDTLKIDKSFVDTLISDSNTKIITESIIYMVKKLGFETVAEGVETREQFEYLKSIQCDNIQGYFLGKPMPPHEVEQLLKEAVS